MADIITNTALIDLCFKNEASPKDNKHNSILYLLRREIKHCFGINPDNGQANGFYAKWPGTMAIMAGIDLLAKYNAGTVDSQNVGPRFKTFLETYWSLNSDEQEVIWQLRNSLCHSFALFSTDRKGNEYKFFLSESASKIITKSNQNSYQIGLDKLFDRFYIGISNYEKAVYSDDNLKDNLIAVFCKIGIIGTT